MRGPLPAPPLYALTYPHARYVPGATYPEVNFVTRVNAA
jgi:hypothetical protein